LLQAIFRFDLHGAYRIAAVLIISFLTLQVVSQPVMAQIAPGVQQSAAHTGNITGTVTQSDGTPVVGVDVRLTGPAMLTTKSDAHGSFSFISVPYGVYRIAATISGLGVASRDGVVVKGDITVAIQYIAQSAGMLKEIARVSTSSSGAQINVTAASIASVNPSDYAFQGNTSWKELLNRIPGVTVGGQLAGGASAADVIPNSPIQPVILSINGALPYETATMIDGMPFYNVSAGSGGEAGQGTDLSNVPMTTFETADVVRGPGADAPSIVDSIGGSFVLHAPGQVDKNRFEFATSNDPYGGAVVNAKAALRFGRLSTTIIYGLGASPGPLGANAQGILAITPQPLTVNGQPFLGCSGAGASCLGYSPSTSYQGYYNYTNALLVGGVSQSTAWTQHSYALGLAYAITPSITAQIFYTGSMSAQPYSSFEYPVQFAPGPGYSGSIAPGTYNFFYPFMNNTFITQASHFLEEKLTAYIGQGVVRVAALQDVVFENFNHGSLEAPPNGQYTLWGEGYLGTTPPGTPVIYNGTPANLTFSSLSFNEQLRANSRDLLVSYASQVGSTSDIGISYVTSYYDDPITYNYGGFFIGSEAIGDSAATREIRIHAGNKLSDRLSLDASWYFANGSYHVQNPNNPSAWVDSNLPYSAPRLSAVWRANRDVVLRAAAGGGYALPALLQLVGSNGMITCTTICTVSLTNLNLAPEKSFGFDLGTDIRFRDNSVLSFDVYRTNLYGQFFDSEALTGTYTGLPLYTTEYRNLNRTRMEGINLDLRHDVSRGVYWHAALGLTRAYVIDVPPGFYDSTSTGPNSVNTYIIPGVNFNGAYQTPVPYAMGNVQLGYRWSPRKYVDLSPTYYGNNNPYFEPAFMEFDAHAGYPLSKNISLVATFRNITGIYDQSIEVYSPSMGVPTIAGLPQPLFGIPYGPRSAIVTVTMSL